MLGLGISRDLESGNENGMELYLVEGFKEKKYKINTTFRVWVLLTPVGFFFYSFFFRQGILLHGLHRAELHLIKPAKLRVR